MEVTEYKIEAPIERALSLAFVSDLHASDYAPVLSELKEQRVDAVLVGGDFIHSSKVYEKGLEFLAQSSSLYPTFCVYGNHENVFSGDLEAMVKNSGARLLNDESVNFCGVVIGGLRSANGAMGTKWENGVINLDFLYEFEKIDGFKILLCHHPEYYRRYLKNKNINLILSGHAHGGQWRIFGRGIYSPGQGLFPRYTHGMHEGRLIVSRGLANPHIVPRICNPLELVIIRLEPKQKIQHF